MSRIAVIVAGLTDGWREPYYLSTSTSVPDEHQELLDRAINVGQLVRAGRRSQPWIENWWPVNRLPGRKEAL